ncbi:hypothetical protein [uncultured Desulfovibrio sp.]|uniref:hypothetical protein n=1 Tax=uncultured Desulfovibrio sp. TaxID=167968 RepID=UPI00261BAE07|nr:hypothetical protein [uncultured Desulfovibrio sp.]
MGNEEFRIIPGFPGYEISRAGIVRTATGYRLGRSSTGRVQLRSCGRVCRKPVAELVAAAFPSRGCVVCGRQFEPHTSNARCCSPECARIVDNRRPHGALRAASCSNRAVDAPQRRCHDCGKPTNNYRCAACWQKLRGRVDGLGDVEGI